MKALLQRAAAAALIATVATGSTVYAEDTYIKDAYVGYCEDAADEFDISAELLESIIEHESSGNRYAVNYNSTCFGLCQINEKYHRDRMERLGVTYLSDPRGNIRVAADLLSELYEKHGDDTGLVLMCYHGESRAVQKAKEGNYSKYAVSVMDRAAELEKEHGRMK